jgi:hypothetical protein
MSRIGIILGRRLTEKGFAFGSGFSEFMAVAFVFLAIFFSSLMA